MHTLDIAPLRSESPSQKRSGMARVLRGFHSFTCTPTRSSAIVMSHTCLCLPSHSWYSFTDPKGMEGRVDLDTCVCTLPCKVMRVEIVAQIVYALLLLAKTRLRRKLYSKHIILYRECWKSSRTIRYNTRCQMCSTPLL